MIETSDPTTEELLDAEVVMFTEAKRNVSYVAHRSEPGQNFVLSRAGVVEKDSPGVRQTLHVEEVHHAMRSYGLTRPARIIRFSAPSLEELITADVIAFSFEDGDGVRMAAIRDPESTWWTVTDRAGDYALTMIKKMCPDTRSIRILERIEEDNARST